jgi:hypothetical protein
LRVLFLLTAILLSAPVSALAVQTAGGATGSIEGTVRDASGEVVADVAVTVSSDALMDTRATVTNAQGRYRIAALPPGEYALTFVRTPYSGLEQTGVRIGLGFTATLDARLALPVVRQEVTVHARGSALDRHSTALTTTFDSDRLAELPGSRSMFALLALSPAIEVVRIEVGGSSGAGGGPYSAFGTRGANRPMVEGISVAGILPSGVTLDYGAFEEVSVLEGAHGAEWPMPGVHMQFIGKSGGNRYRGTLYGDYENQHWQAVNIDKAQIAQGVHGGSGLSPRDINRMWEYHDVNGDVGGFVVRNRLWWYSSVRQQEIAARLVNLPTAPHRTRLANYGGKVTYAITSEHKLIAFAQAGRNHQPTRVDPVNPPGTRVTPTTVINESTGSTANQHSLGWVWKAEWNAVIAGRLLFEARAGEFGADQRWQPNSRDPRVEDQVTQKVYGGNRDWDNAVRRDQFAGAVNYFHDGRSGGHHLQLGGDVFRTIEIETWRSAYPGNVLHLLESGRPSQVYFFHTPSQSQSGLWSYSGHVSDSWRIGDHVTVNLGFRFDRYRVFLPAQEHPAGDPAAQRFNAVSNMIDWNVIVPRVGAVYAPGRNGRTLLKVSYGKYRNPPGTALGFEMNPNSTQWWNSYDWIDSNGTKLWEPGEERQLKDQRGGSTIESLDPQLKLPVVDEAAVWTERQFRWTVGVQAGVVWRRERQQYARQNENQPFDAFSVPVTLPDPGIDGIAGNADDGAPVRAYGLDAGVVGVPPSYVVGNVPGSSSENWTMELRANRQGRGGSAVGGSFSHTWNGDQASGYAGQPVRNNTYPVTPNDLIHTGDHGRHEFTTWTAKAHGTYRAPWGLRITSVLRHQSGQPFGRTLLTSALGYGSIRVLVEPVGARRMENVTIIDTRVEKKIRLGSRGRITPFVEVFNLLNDNPVRSAMWLGGSTFLRPLSVVPPRVARVGARFDW